MSSSATASGASSIARSPPITSAGRRRARSAARCGEGRGGGPAAAPTCRRNTAARGADFLYSAVLTEEMARRVFSGPGFRLHSDIVAPYILHYGSEEQKRAGCRAWRRGEVIGAHGHDRARHGQRPAGHPHHGAAPGQRAGGERLRRPSSPTASSPTSSSSPAKTDARAGAKGVSLVLVETDRPASSAGAT